MILRPWWTPQPTLLGCKDALDNKDYLMRFLRNRRSAVEMSPVERSEQLEPSIVRASPTGSRPTDTHR